MSGTQNRHTMETPISASFRWTVDELLTAQRIHMKHSKMGRKIQRVSRIFGPLALIAGIALGIMDGLDARSFFFSVGGIFFITLPLLARHAIRRQFAKRPDRDKLVTYEFDSERITSKSDASFASFEWKLVSRVLRASEGYLIYLNEQMFHWIPVAAFPGGENTANLSKLVKTKVADFIDLTASSPSSIRETSP